MRKYLISSLIIILLGCDKKEILKTNDSVIWQPKPTAIINDRQVQLNWYNSIIDNQILRPYEIVNPDKFEIYISTKIINGFNKLIEINDDGVYTYSLDNLENNKAYYFYVVSQKKGYSSLLSDTIMVIPNQKFYSENLISSGEHHTIVSVAGATKLNKIAYVDYSYTWDGGDNCCIAASILISNFDGSEAELLEINSYDPSWSPDNYKLVFRTKNGETNLGNGIPSQIALFDYETKEINRLTDDTVFNYAPVFSKNGELLLFASSKNGPGGDLTNIWAIDLVTNESSQVTDIEGCNLKNAGRPNWINNEEFLFQGLGFDNKSHIYKSTITTKQIKRFIDSEWNDYCPSISPDNSKIAFVSDRSGSNQIWIYNSERKEFKQLTGFSNEEYIVIDWCKIEWVDNYNILFTLGEKRLVKQRIE